MRDSGVNPRQLLPPEAGNDNTAADPQCVLEGFVTAKGLRRLPVVGRA